MRHSYRSAQGEPSEGVIIMSASPHCGDGPSRAHENGAASPSVQDPTAGGSADGDCSADARQNSHPLQSAAAADDAVVASVEISDPLTLAARELMLLREASQVGARP